jgi:pteridine reductase
MQCTGKVALVTGSSRRVGRAIALALAEAGCDIAVHYRSSRSEAQQVVEAARGQGRRAILVAGDLADLATPQRLVAECIAGLGRLDVLVNNASVFEGRTLADSDAAFWEQTFRANTFASALLARAVAPHMQAAGAGRIINLADILVERPPRDHAAYIASKAALVGLTRALARDLAPIITVNAIAPGIAEFPDDYDAATREKLVSKVPLLRAGTPEEIAALARFLVEKGDYITGQIIPIDGGRSIQP